MEVSIWRSLGLHALWIALAWMLWQQREPDRQANEPIHVEVLATSGEQDRKPSPRHLRPGSPRPTRGAIRGQSKIVTLDDLGMQFDPLAIAADDAASEIVDNRDPEGDGWDLLNPDPKVARFNRYLYQVVQRELDRESRLGLRPFLGTVQITLWFDREGNYLEARTDYRAIDSDFRELVARSLRRAFAEPIPRQYVYLDRAFSVRREVFVRRYN